MVTFDFSIPMDMFVIFYKNNDVTDTSSIIDASKHLESLLQDHTYGRYESDIARLYLSSPNSDEIHILSLKKVKLKSGKFIWKYFSESKKD